MTAEGPFDLVLNFAAIKHVRSEKNRFTLLHMIDVNVVKQQRIAETLRRTAAARRYFVVSTDKAADPASFMGATKHLLEQLVFAQSSEAGGSPTSAARFANVAYSSGSLLESYLQRFAAVPGLAAPRDNPPLLHRRPRSRAHLHDRPARLPRRPDRRAEVRLHASGAVELADTAARFLAWAAGTAGGVRGQPRGSRRAARGIQRRLSGPAHAPRHRG